MAGGIYGGAAAGLESGFNMAMRLDQAQQDRQLREQQLAMQQRAADRADAMTAFTTARQLRDDLAKEGSGLAMQYGANVPQDIASDYVSRVQSAHDAYTAAASKLVPHVQAEKQAGQNLFSDLQAGNVKLQDVPPGQFVQALTATTGRPVSDFMPGPNGEPSPVEQGLTKLKTGLQTGNEQYVLDGANAMLAPELQKGVGQPSPHGGTIVGKKIVKFLPMPPSDPNNPNDPNDPNKGKVVPVLRVFVSNQDPQAGVGEKRAQMQQEAQQYGAPEGATGHYDAPLTQYRSTDPNDPIAHLDINEAMDRAMRLGSIASMMRNPQFAGYVDQGVKQAGSAPNDFLNALYSTGGTMPTKPLVTAHSVAPGGKLVFTNPQGQVVSTVEGGQPVTKPSVHNIIEGANEYTGIVDPVTGKVTRLGPSGPRHFAPAGSAGSGKPEDWSLDAQIYLDTGKPPVFNRGEDRSAFRAAVHQEAQKRGMTGADVVADRATVDADRSSLKQLQPQLDAIEAFENNAKVQGQRLVSLADKVDTTGVPVVERWIRGGRKAVAGDPDVSAFNAQLQLYRTEAARIMANPRLTGQLTDSARHEVEDFLGGNESAQQIKQVVNLLNTDFDTRRDFLISQRNSITKRLGGQRGGVNASLGGAPAPAPAAPGAPTQISNDADYNALPSGAEFIAPDGSHRRKP